MIFWLQGVTDFNEEFENCMRAHWRFPQQQLAKQNIARYFLSQSSENKWTN